MESIKKVKNFNPSCFKDKYCKFCKVIKDNDKNKILFQDEVFVIFKDIKNRAKLHLQAVPKEHITDINSLKTVEHYKMIQHMVEKSLAYLFENFEMSSEYRLGFHKPPFNSVPHLHMHCIIPPFNTERNNKVTYGARLEKVENILNKLVNANKESLNK
jgi:diadenosine tetraphosphate (Ap4A) HIT family hydrolase